MEEAKKVVGGKMQRMGVTSPALDLLHVQLPLWELSPSWAPAVLGLLLVRATLKLFLPS